MLHIVNSFFVAVFRVFVVGEQVMKKLNCRYQGLKFFLPNGRIRLGQINTDPYGPKIS